MGKNEVQLLVGLVRNKQEDMIPSDVFSLLVNGVSLK